MNHKLNVLTAAIALACSSFTALAEEEAKPMHQFSANVALTTDYMFRGISQTNDGPAVQGGFDYQYTPIGFYAGAWASNVELAFAGTAAAAVNNRASMELDYYGGFAGAFSNGVGWDIGGIYYSYPGQGEDGVIIDKNTGAVLSSGANYGYEEMYFKTGYAFDAVQFKPTVKAGVFFSPDYFGEDGNSVYGFSTLGVTLPMDFGLSATVAYLSVDGDKTTGVSVGGNGYDYVHYSIGVSKTLGKLTMNLSWNDADDGCLKAAERASLCNGVVFAVSSAW